MFFYGTLALPRSLSYTHTRTHTHACVLATRPWARGQGLLIITLLAELSVSLGVRTYTLFHKSCFASFEYVRFFSAS